MQNSFKTQKGTVLPILMLRGKEYLEVKYRLVWFREEHPNWSIETEIVSQTEKQACMRAVIKDESGRIIATSHKVENVQGFGDFLEKAETGSIGRALALIGYGTQFCGEELDEGDRIVDAPAKPAIKPISPISPIDALKEPHTPLAKAEMGLKKTTMLSQLRSMIVANKIQLAEVYRINQELNGKEMPNDCSEDELRQVIDAVNDMLAVK